MSTKIDIERVYELGKAAIAAESAAVSNLINKIDHNFAKACQLLLECDGHAIVIGMGKSGHIANKIAATFASTGTPAFFVHPAEAGHGDMGMITTKDVIVAISNSGNTAEIVALLPLIARLNIPLISITSRPNSTLAKTATVNLDIGVEKEACPLGLAPTSSTTATLALGDALAITLLELRGFTSTDFAFSHPNGNLGKRLLLKIDDLMRTGKAIPKVGADAALSTALLEITAKTLGMTTVVDSSNQLIGIFTDGDLRRTLEKSIDIHNTLIIEVMTKGCKTIQAGALAYDALQLMEQFKITSLVVVNKNNNVVGVIHIHDILQAGISA